MDQIFKVCHLFLYILNSWSYILVENFIPIYEIVWISSFPSSNHPLQACKFLDETWYPKFTVIVSQRRHHTKFFEAGSKDDIPPGNLLPPVSKRYTFNHPRSTLVYSKLIDGLQDWWWTKKFVICSAIVSSWAPIWL